MPIASRTRRRLALAFAGLAAIAVVATSCSLDAAVATDEQGQVIRLDALQLRSEALDLAVALAFEGSELVLELRWRLEHGGTTIPL